MTQIADIHWRAVAMSYGSAAIIAGLLCLGIVFAPRWERRAGILFAGLMIVPYCAFLAVGFVMNPPHLTVRGASILGIACIAMAWGVSSLIRIILSRTKP